MTMLPGVNFLKYLKIVLIKAKQANFFKICKKKPTIILHTDCIKYMRIPVKEIYFICS